MMIIVNRTEELITGSYNGKPFSVSFDDSKYEAMMALMVKANTAATMDELNSLIAEFEPLTKESYGSLIQTKTPYILVNKSTNKFYLKFGDKVHSKPLPQVFVDKIVKSAEKNIPFTPLIKCWVRFLRNPNYTDAKARLFAEYILAPYMDTKRKAEFMAKEGFSDKVATEYATTSQVSISQEGLLVGYKVVRELRQRYAKTADGRTIEMVEAYEWDVDPITGSRTYKEPEFAEQRIYEPPCMGQGGDEFFCGTKKGHIVQVGQLIALEDWKQVDCNDSRSGEPGLHVGGLNYIQGFQNDGTITCNVFIDPMDIGAIVGLGLGNDGAMRVLRYFVYGTFQGVNKSLYHSSQYAALTDKEYADMVQKAVATSEMKKAEADKMIEESKALQNTNTSDGSNPEDVARVFEQH